MGKIFMNIAVLHQHKTGSKAWGIMHFAALISCCSFPRRELRFCGCWLAMIWFEVC